MEEGVQVTFVPLRDRSASGSPVVTNGIPKTLNAGAISPYRVYLHDDHAMAFDV